MLGQAAATRPMVFHNHGVEAVRIQPMPNGTILLSNIGADYTAPVDTMDHAIAKAERILRMLRAGGGRR